MVSYINLTILIINILLSAGVPFAFLILVKIKGFRCYTAFLTGIVTFIVSQVVIRVPLNMWFGDDFAKNSSWGYLAFGVISAAILEEVGRYIGMKVGLKDSTRLIDGVSFGIGFAGCYNIFFSCVSYLGSFLTAMKINQTGVQSFLDSIDGDEIASLATDQLINTPWYKMLILGVHDIAWLTIEVALSIIVLYGLKCGLKKSLLFLLIAACAHVFMEGVVIFLSDIVGLSGYKTEIYTLCLAAIAFVVIIMFKKLKLFEKQISPK